ncbi:C1 family peptidase [Nitrobacter sp. TKz-YC01]|uniref:C1 family peptidase n=1 Tax=Nitrobacter sp. TKz-YC01 TaxID=3398703 RepID=UPI003A0FC3AE
MAKRAKKMANRRSSRKPAGKQPRERVTADLRATEGLSDDGIPADDSEGSSRDLSVIEIGNRAFLGRATKLGKRRLDILPDMPDIRDRIYMPHLRALYPAIYPRIAFSIRDQGLDSSCTGFSLAHVIDFLRFHETSGDSPQRVSARMLYEMAKKNDEWSGSNYEGSSIRGAIKGLFRNGVCSEETAPDDPAVQNWALTYEMAKEARETRLGAYFRLQPDLSDYHAALNETGIIYVSAQIHSNWTNPINAYIEPGGKSAGGHAFAIVGYDEAGFWILNSWGPSWGNNGLAHWSYDDWATNVMDAWILQLGVRAPNAFGVIARSTLSTTSGPKVSGEPGRGDIIGHFINIDDGRLVTDGKYGSPSAEEMQETVKRLTLPQSNKGKGYDHLVIYAHGGLNSLSDEAKRIAAWKRTDIFGRNGLYNFHLMWGSGFIDEVFGKLSESPAGARVGGRFSDWLFEAGLGKEAGSYAWRNMKQDARVAFSGGDDYNGGIRGLSPLLTALDKSALRPKLHFVGHSAGAIVLGNLLSTLKTFRLKQIELGSIHLMAPACTVDFFNQNYGPYLKDQGALKLRDKVYLYNLTNELELEDTVSAGSNILPSYSHSLLYLVSRAYEDKPGTPLAGMQLFRGGMPTHSRLDIEYSSPKGKTASRTHGGFDNDASTLTTVMSRILGAAAPVPPRNDELMGY